MRTLRILVVDDQEHMRELLLEALSADVHSVEPAENGMAAVKLFDTQPYDLVVSDLQMPQMDGPRLYRELEQRRPEGMPGFVFITGEDEAPELETDTRVRRGLSAAAAARPSLIVVVPSTRLSSSRCW